MFTMGPPLWGNGEGGGVAPLDIAALYGSSQGLWYDYTDASTVFSDALGTVPATPGSTLKSIRSKSPEATLLVTSPVSDWPWTVDSNGTVSADLDGTREMMTGYALPLGAEGIWTQAVLFTAASGTLGSLVDSDLIGTRTFQGLMARSDFSYYQLFAPMNVIGDTRGAGSPGLNVPRLTSARISQAATSIRSGGVEVNSGALTHALPSVYAANIYVGGAILSGNTPPYQRYNGRIYCLMMINRYLTDEEVVSVETEMLRVAGLL